MSNAAINSLVHIFGVYTLFSMGYIPAFLPLKKFRGEIEMLTSQKCGTTWPFDSLKKKLNLNLPYDPIIPLLGIYPRETKT